jgi:hypothetical protein
MSDNPEYYSLQKRCKSLTVTENTLWIVMKVKFKNRDKLNKHQSAAEQVLKHYGVKGHEIHECLKDITKTGETEMILPNMHESVVHYLKACIESSSNMSMLHLARGAQSLNQIDSLYADEADNARIIKDYLSLAQDATSEIEASVNDDAVVAAIHLVNSQRIDIGLNYVNDMTKRWMLGAVYSIWSNSFTVIPYCYPVQPCDAGRLDIYTTPTKNHPHWKKAIGDTGRWSRGKDTSFQQVGITMNAYPRTCLQDADTRASYVGNPDVENLDKTTNMSLARQTAVAMNNGNISAQISDHELSYGRIVGWLEWLKSLPQDAKQLLLTWGEIERFLGSSGQGAGAQQDRYKTSENLAQVHFYHTNEGPVICFASKSVNTSTSPSSEALVATARRVTRQTPPTASSGIKYTLKGCASQLRPRKQKRQKTSTTQMTS